MQGLNIYLMPILPLYWACESTCCNITYQLQKLGVSCHKISFTVDLGMGYGGWGMGEGYG